jgi:hypothetical protein
MMRVVVVLAAVPAAVLAAVLAVEAHQAHGTIMEVVGMLTLPILQDIVYFGSLQLEVL